MRIPQLIAPVVVVALSSCSRTPEPSGTSQNDSGFPITPDAKVTLSIEPGDVLTDVGFTPIRVNVRPYDTPLTTLTAISKGIRVRSYPTLVDIPISTVVHPGSAGGTGSGPVPEDGGAWAGPEDAYVEVVVKGNMPPTAWFAITVDGLPKEVVPVSRSVMISEPAAFVARFATGSSPVVRSVSINEKGFTKVTFSEGVVVDEKSIAGVMVVTDDKSQPCSYVPRGIPNGPPSFG